MRTPSTNARAARNNVIPTGGKKIPVIVFYFTVNESRTVYFCCSIFTVISYLISLC